LVELGNMTQAKRAQTRGKACRFSIIKKKSRRLLLEKGVHGLSSDDSAEPPKWESADGTVNAWTMVEDDFPTGSAAALPEGD
jgi:hypothetical protein